MRDLLIVHPGTGTVIPLSDQVLVVDSSWVTDVQGEVDIGKAEYYGIRLDNYNMTNLFYGGK